MYKVSKARKLANGFELGKGYIIHYCESSFYGPALCGTKLTIQWIERQGFNVTCKRCLKEFFSNSAKVLNESAE